MKVYTQKYKQFIHADIDTVWDFFSNPSNLGKITPAEMNFKTLYITGGETMYAGQLMSYKVSPFPFMRIRWTTEIKVAKYQQHFIDEQKFGPFAMWYHQHFFEVKDGGVEMIDEISYAIPFGFLGRLANSLLVEKQVKNIFKFRKEAVERIFKQIEVVTV
jgi:ligand-binding SRPBCC domain-containing protein